MRSEQLRSGTPAGPPPGSEAHPADGPAVVRGFLDAFIRADAEELIALCDPEIELHPLPLTEIPEYRAHDGVRRWLEDLSERRVELSFLLEEVRALDGHRALARVELRSGGQRLAEVIALFTVKAGTVMAVRGYFSDEDLLCAVGVI